MTDKQFKVYLCNALRLGLTGKESGLPLSVILSVFGKYESISRLNSFLEFMNSELNRLNKS